MAFDLNKNKESKTKPKFNLSKASGLPPETKNISEQNPYNQPTERKNNKFLLISIVGVLCISAAIWFFVNKGNTTSPQTTRTEQLTSADNKSQNKATNAVGGEGTSENANTAPSGSKPTPQAKSPEVQSSNAVQASAVPSLSQTAQDTPKKTNTTEKKVSQPTPTSNSGTSYQKNKSYRVYLFPFGNFNYSETNPELEKLANELTQNPSMKISISAYTDDIGDAEFNKSLSALRAKSIHDYLRSKGIGASRMKYQGKGISTTYENKAENRRAEFEISD